MNHNSSLSDTRNMVLCAMCAAITCVLAPLSIPLAGGVPVSLATFAVMLAGVLLGGTPGAVSQLIYVLLGAVGLPVFSGFTGGIGILLGNTGGYIIGFLFSALAMWGIECAFGNGRVKRLISMLVGLLICYAFGTVWFMAVYTRGSGPVSLLAVLGWCVFPFIIPDLVKIGIAFVISPRIRKHLVR